MKRRTLALLPAFALAARAIACGEEIADIPNPAAPLPDGAAGGIEAGSSSGGPGGRPSFCEGIVLYASFDRGIQNPDIGQVLTERAGSAATAKGHYGDGVGLLSDASDGGAAVYWFGADAGGATALPYAEGSLALWHRSTADAITSSRVLYRFVGNRPDAVLVPTGLTFVRLQNQIGFYQTVSAIRPILVVEEAKLAPYLREGDYNHYFGAWKASEEGGVGPTAWLAVNGGFGLVLRDAGSDGGAATPDDAGNLPFLATTNSRWLNGPEPAALRIGGPAGSATEGSLDDVVVWNRVVSFEEAAAVYGAGVSVGDVCGLAAKP